MKTITLTHEAHLIWAAGPSRFARGPILLSPRDMEEAIARAILISWGT